MQFNIHEAKTHFSKLVAAVENGEKVTICRNGKPVIECVPSQSTTSFPFGSWGKLSCDSEALEHLAEPTDDDLLNEMGV